MSDEILMSWQPPDDDLLDLIEFAFLDGAIDGITVSLSTYRLETNLVSVH